MSFFQRLSIRKRIFLMLTLLLGVNLSGAALTLWYAHETQHLYTLAISHDLEALTAAQQLENALAVQKGLVTYYLHSNDPVWLQELEKHRQKFQESLGKARDTTNNEEGRALLNRIESSYLAYAFARSKVIEFHEQGKDKEREALHPEVREQFYAIYKLCDEYRALHEHQIAASTKSYQHAASWVTALAWTAMPASVILAVVMAWIFLREIILPIRKLAYGESQALAADGDEFQALSDKMLTLMQNVDKVQSKLDRSREQMLQTEKLAVVGKMAAGVAHTIRNPLTSVKMRLFTLERGLSLEAQQKEDFDVISEEIRHIDSILRNFLEFSRPPKLQMQSMSPSDVVDMTLQLLRHRLDSYDVSVTVQRHERLPQVLGDPDQIKEALMNLLLNACEAMGEKGGQIKIMEEEGVVEPWGRVAILRIKDNGPGIPEKAHEQIMEPFFSTKEDGTGLGLSIVRRIMDEHGGWVHLHSQEGEGATFVLGLPCKEKEAWLRS